MVHEECVGCSHPRHGARVLWLHCDRQACKHVARQLAGPAGLPALESPAAKTTGVAFCSSSPANCPRAPADASSLVRSRQSFGFTGKGLAGALSPTLCPACVLCFLMHLLPGALPTCSRAVRSSFAPLVCQRLINNQSIRVSAADQPAHESWCSRRNDSRLCSL